MNLTCSEDLGKRFSEGAPSILNFLKSLAQKLGLDNGFSKEISDELKADLDNTRALIDGKLPGNSAEDPSWKDVVSIDFAKVPLCKMVAKASSLNDYAVLGPRRPAGITASPIRAEPLNC